MATARTKKETVTGAVKPEETKTTEKVEPVKEKRVFTGSDYILCRSVTYGGLNVTSQSGNLYEFKNYGAECEINYRDLVTMIRNGSEHVFMPRFVILDSDMLEEFPTIKRSYEKMYTRNDLLEILDLPVDRMKSAIAELPDATAKVLCQMVASEISNGHLDSIRKVRVLSEIFDSDFNLLSELFVR